MSAQNNFKLRGYVMITGRKKISYCWKGADRTTLSGTDLLHADDGFSRRGNLYGFRLLVKWLEFIH